MTRFVLVHGASHGKWCWDRVVSKLRHAGHDVVAIDLPSHPDVTLSQYRDAILEHIRPGTVLVGHSLGGLSITLAAAAGPEDIASLVYVVAFVPAPGERFVSIRDTAVSARIDTVTMRDGPFSVPINDAIGDVFYNGCTHEARDFAISRISPQPISVMLEPLEFEPISHRRHYVRCLDDRVVLPEYQRMITSDWPEGTVHDLDTGHSPFLSEPDRLAHILNVIATETT